MVKVEIAWKANCAAIVKCGVGSLHIASKV